MRDIEKITCTSRKITRYLTRCKETVAEGVARGKFQFPVQNTTSANESQQQSPEQNDADCRWKSRISILEDMLEKLSGKNLIVKENNVQKSVELEQLDQGMKNW